MLLKSMVLWMLKHTLLSSVNNICRNMKIVETQNFASLFCFWIFWNIWNASLFWGGIVVGLVIIMALGILVALVVLVALDFIDALVF